jgi:transcriptional regulator with XRE-family HTH domain
MKLKELRESRALLQKDVAAYLNCSVPVYCRYEKGDRVPSMETLKSLADFYHVTVDYILGRDLIESAQKNDLPGPGEIDGAIAALSADLTPEELQLVIAYAEGIKAARKA